MQTISWARIWVWVISFLVILGIGLGGMISYASSYEARVLPGVAIGSVQVGGMDREELTAFFRDMNNKLVDAGIILSFDTDGHTQRVYIESSVVSQDAFYELIQMNVNQEVEHLLSYQKTGNLLTRGWSAILVRMSKPQLELTTVTLDRERLEEVVAEKLAPYAEDARNADIHVTSVDPLLFNTVSSTIGVTFAYQDIIGKIVAAWNALEVPEITIVRAVQNPTLVETDVQSLLDRLPRVIDAGDLDLTYTYEQTKKEYIWTISTDDIAEWLEVQIQEDAVGFGLNASSTKAYIEETIALEIDQDAREAKFAIGQNSKVNEFQGSRPGIAVDMDALYTSLNEAILQRTWHDEGFVTSLPVIVKQVEPAVKTGEVNDLGITEILGTGYSNFSGSPTNRVKNIRHAVVDKLNGLLIKPDEVFSLLGALRPFTIEGGYLPELVIKGDEIKPEVAGGLCQVGTTLFRTVMNAGLDVVNRRNHSLVVSYYNDQRNGNPGTDATIYDPAPDFTFKNDTGHYILLTTSMNTQNGDLTFTFWGTSDGREGRYTEPVVKRWIPTGPEQIIETTDLAPGVRNCQSAHPGAETTFTYIRVLPNGEEEKEVFDSYYRPLPKICLVGAEKKVETQTCETLPDGNVSCTPLEVTEDTPAPGTETTEVVPPVVGEETTVSTGQTDVGQS
ncbi:MAG: hypothetical protein COU34_00060 [Candidatus Magasanikbacteria bacterium CG10_big_fil_rev_8_21_14_0_10_43_9]|nr:MAG: hypothetical protein COU34_00060 [Candidatus Magasanikbacteria bacterium CG10_big_fil_rev_8_21_14_0_10_43_9]